MSVIDDIHPACDDPSPRQPAFSRLRDMLLVLCLTILGAMALASWQQAGVAGGDGVPAVLDWKGNSGSLPQDR